MIFFRTPSYSLIVIVNRRSSRTNSVRDREAAKTCKKETLRSNGCPFHRFLPLIFRIANRHNSVLIFAISFFFFFLLFYAFTFACIYIPQQVVRTDRRRLLATGTFRITRRYDTGILWKSESKFRKVRRARFCRFGLRCVQSRRCWAHHIPGCGFIPWKRTKCRACCCSSSSQVRLSKSGGRGITRLPYADIRSRIRALSFG